MNLLRGDRKRNIFPVTLSIAASFLSAVFLLGTPAEVYYNGSMFWIISFSKVLVFSVTAHCFLPVFHNLRITSAYELGLVYYGLRPVLQAVFLLMF